MQGQYSLVDSDGSQRVVDYSADDLNGFNAVVKKIPLAKAVVAAPAPIVAPAVPAISAYAAPLAAPYAYPGYHGYGYHGYGYPYGAIARYY